MRKVHEHHDQAAAAHRQTHEEALRQAAVARAQAEAQQAAAAGTDASAGPTGAGGTDDTD